MRSEQLRHTDEYIFLAGRPPVQHFVRFVKTMGVDGHLADELSLTREWQEASRHLQHLESAEAGIADRAEVTTLPAEIAAMAEAREPASRRSLSYLPQEWCTIELDRLIVSQKSINSSFASAIKDRLPSQPTHDDLIRVATGSQTNSTPVRVTQLSGNSFSFSSASNDLRVLSAAQFDPARERDMQLHGHPLAAIGLFVGYSSNLLTALHFENRLLLLNGSHRAYALRSLGVTHAPCLVQRAQQRNDLDLVGMPDLKSNFDQLFRSPRPPLFKDYFDPKLRKIVSTHRTTTVLHVELTIQQLRVPVGE